MQLQPENFRLHFTAQWLEDTIPKKPGSSGCHYVEQWLHDWCKADLPSKIWIYSRYRWSPKDKFRSIHHFHVWLQLSSLGCCGQSDGFAPYRVPSEYSLLHTRGISTLKSMWISTYMPCSLKGNQDLALRKQLLDLFSVPDASNGVGVGRRTHPPVLLNWADLFFLIFPTGLPYPSMFLLTVSHSLCLGFFFP